MYPPWSPSGIDLPGWRQRSCPRRLDDRPEPAVRARLAAVRGRRPRRARRHRARTTLPSGRHAHAPPGVRGVRRVHVLSIEAFAAPGADPARIAAQIVTGIGFLGAGAILKDRGSIKGLTTAASLWVVAAIGMASGAGAYGVAVATTVIVIVSLWPLQVIERRLFPDTDDSLDD